MADEVTKNLIVGTGRCGSSILCAILPDAGGRFATRNEDLWGRRHGAFENEEVYKAARLLDRAESSRSVLHSGFLFNTQRRLRSSRAKRQLRRILKQADFLKVNGGHPGIVHLIDKMKYRPRIILIYRKFEDVARSQFHAFAWPFGVAAERYRNINFTCLTMMNIYGGCAVDYDDITNFRETDWATALAESTGLDEGKIIAARQARVKPARALESPDFSLPAGMDDVYLALRELKGVAVPPSRLES